MVNPSAQLFAIKPENTGHFRGKGIGSPYQQKTVGAMMAYPGLVGIDVMGGIGHFIKILHNGIEYAICSKSQKPKTTHRQQDFRSTTGQSGEKTKWSVA
jgi:hypothetical protein